MNENKFLEKVNEIKRLRRNEYVQLAMKADEVEAQLDAELKHLRELERKGLALAAAGVDLERLWCGDE